MYKWTVTAVKNKGAFSIPEFAYTNVAVILLQIARQITHVWRGGGKRRIAAI